MLEIGVMDAHAAQWIGKRPKQEDAYGVRHFPDGSLAVVCDGMGGHSRGDVASSTAVKAFIASFQESAETASPTERLHNALLEANAAVGKLYEGTETYGGTTLLAVYAGHGTLRWVSVGDSGLYLWRQGTLRRLNEDHSMRAVYEKFVCPGGMTRREALAGGHVLRSALTGEDMPLIDEHERPFPLLPGDRIVLCSDGLESVVESGVLSPAVRRLFLQVSGSLAADLVQVCVDLQEPYADNVTVVTLDA